MSLMGAGYASNASGTAGMGDGRMNNMGNDTRMMNQEGNIMNGTTGTNRNDTIMNDKVRTGNNNSTVSPLSNDRTTGRYRATSTTTTGTTTNRSSNWGWLGLVGLLGLAGMRSRTREDNK
ncbi:WGxxGxxG-CTERM domain-containing protein [Paenibacillus sp. 19GGS1-52]|nr:WGxxGxxG-CTERM domain-containing protein [Paenibacillus sp. 19GGS1-52]